jgi:hypothetical protein
MYLRGKLHFVQNESLLRQCPCEALSDPPLSVLIVISGGNPNPINGATIYIKGLGYTEGACVEIVGNFGTVGDNVKALVMTSIHNCPNPSAPCRNY